MHALRVLPQDTVVAFYNGVRVTSWVENSWEECSYRILLHNDTEEGEDEDNEECMDIPEEMREISNYCATVAHKVNHSFRPNCRFSRYNHPLYGVIPCVVTTELVQRGSELYSYYKYLLSDCPDWYAALWEEK